MNGEMFMISPTIAADIVDDLLIYFTKLIQIKCPKFTNMDLRKIIYFFVIANFGTCAAVYFTDDNERLRFIKKEIEALIKGLEDTLIGGSLSEIIESIAKDIKDNKRH